MDNVWTRWTIVLGPRLIVPDIASLQRRDTGTFAGDEWGEVDTRFLYGALNALSLLGLTRLVDVDKAVQHVKSCENVDGGFGWGKGAESHSGAVFTCMGALSIAGRLDLVDVDKTGGWLSERQLSNGGLNGRPEKLEDVCYSWWVLSSLAMIGRLHWIDKDKIAKFILNCQVSRAVKICPDTSKVRKLIHFDRIRNWVDSQIGLTIWWMCFTPSLVSLGSVL